MKILHIITSLRTGGAEKLMVDLLPRLRDFGNEVELLLFDGTRTPFYDELEKVDVKIHHLAIGGNVYNPLNIFRLRKYLKNYDIIHTHNTACQYFVPLAKISLRAKCKLFTTEHNTFNRRRTIFGWKYIDRFIYSQYKTIISISEKATDNLIAFIGNKYKIRTIENGIDLSKFKFLSPVNFNSKDKIITMIAGFRKQKDQDTLIKAISLLPQEYRLWLVGDGERRTILEDLVTELYLGNRVKFLGIRSDIPQILEKSHIVVLSSHWEGFGLAAVEGMASGRPVIVSDVGGLREIVRGYGILFPPQDAKTLANEIKSLCENKNRYNQIALACQEKAKQYEIKKMVLRYNLIYENS